MELVAGADKSVVYRVEAAGEFAGHSRICCELLNGIGYGRWIRYFQKPPGTAGKMDHHTLKENLNFHVSAR